jgi:hypothetical protein
LGGGGLGVGGDMRGNVGGPVMTLNPGSGACKHNEEDEAKVIESGRK